MVFSVASRLARFTSRRENFLVFFCFVGSACACALRPRAVFRPAYDFALEKESRKHYNQLEEARKQQHARKLKLEAQEVALGERDRVTATLGDSLFVGELLPDLGRGEGEGICVVVA